MHQVVIGITYTEGEDMNTLAVRCCPLHRVGGSYWQHRRVCFLLSLAFGLGAWISESLLLLHKATLQASRAPTCTSTSCALSKTHAFISWAVKSWERQEWYKIPPKAQVSVTCARPFQHKQLPEWLLLSRVNLQLFPVICLENCSPVWPQVSENCLEVIQQLSTNPCAKDREGRRWGENVLLNYRANLIFLRCLLCTLHLHTYQTCVSIWTAVAAHWINNCWSNGSREVCFTSALHKDKMLSFVSLFSLKSLHFRIRGYTDLKKKGFSSFI